MKKTARMIVVAMLALRLSSILPAEDGLGEPLFGTKPLKPIRVPKFLPRSRVTNDDPYQGSTLYVSVIMLQT